MHIPDGFINTPVAAATGVIAAGFITYAVKATNKKIGEKQVPMMGVLAVRPATLRVQRYLQLSLGHGYQY